MSPPLLRELLFTASSLSACRDRQPCSVGYSNNGTLDNTTRSASCYKHIWKFPCFRTTRRLGNFMSIKKHLFITMGSSYAKEKKCLAWRSWHLKYKKGRLEVIKSKNRDKNGNMKLAPPPQKTNRKRERNKYIFIPLIPSECRIHQILIFLGSTILPETSLTWIWRQHLCGTGDGEEVLCLLKARCG